MADKQVKVAKPEKTKPHPVKPEPTKTTPIKPIKACGTAVTSCVRCSGPVTDHYICAPCDLALQEMHWNVEHQLFRRTVYIPPVPHDEGPPLSWLMTNGYAEHIRKPPRPSLRQNFPPKLLQPKAAPAMAPG